MVKIVLLLALCKFRVINHLATRPNNNFLPLKPKEKRKKKRVYPW